jgi:hypothetical protein
MGAGEGEVGRTEASSRDINEGIEQSHGEARRAGYVRVMCECGRADCDRLIAVTREEYEGIRQDGRRFAVAKGHVRPDVERVVGETDRFLVVQKRGAAGAIGEEENPRA